MFKVLKVRVQICITITASFGKVLVPEINAILMIKNASGIFRSLEILYRDSKQNAEENFAVQQPSFTFGPYHPRMLSFT